MSLPMAFHVENAQMETPILNTSDVHLLPENTYCLACSADGLYLSIGYSKGLSLWSASSFKCVAEWSQDSLEITSIQITKLAENTYLLGTIDDMGVARIFMFCSEIIHLLNIINKMEDINSRSICSSFQASQGGDYGVASVRCNGDVWLEVLYFPKESWLKEVESAVSQKQDSNSSLVSEVQWSPVEVINKIKPITCVSDNVYKFPSQFFSHCLALDEKTCSPTGTCTAHFLLPISGERKEKTGLPNAICMWWSGSKNLLQYSLQKATKNKADSQSLPAALWPNANKIVCSAVSVCTRYIALGLTETVVCVWDRNSGSPVSVSSMSDTNSAFSGIHFMDYCPMSPDDSQSFSDDRLHLLAMCKCGDMFTVILGRGTKSHMLQLAERVKDSGDLPTVATAVPFLQGLALVIQRNGKMCLQNIINKRNVCSLILPPKHALATPRSPGFALNSRHRTLLVQGGPGPFSKVDGKNQLYIFRFEECDFVKPYVITPIDSRQTKTYHFSAHQDSCDQYLQERRMSSNEKTKDIKQTWTRLQQTSVMLQQLLPNHI